MNIAKISRPLLAAAMLTALGIGAAAAADACNPCATPPPVRVVKTNPCNPCVKRAKIVCKTDRCDPCKSVCKPSRGFRWFGWVRPEPTYYRDERGYYYY